MPASAIHCNTCVACCEVCIQYSLLFPNHPHNSYWRSRGTFWRVSTPYEIGLISDLPAEWSEGKSWRAVDGMQAQRVSMFCSWRAIWRWVYWMCCICMYTFKHLTWLPTKVLLKKTSLSTWNEASVSSTALTNGLPRWENLLLMTNSRTVDSCY